MSKRSDPNYDEIDRLIDEDTIELGRRYRTALDLLSRFVDYETGYTSDSWEELIAEYRALRGA